MDSLLGKLPQELVDQVYGHLHDDLQSLKCCSLVSKHWRASCGHHLFRSLNLDSYNAPNFLALLNYAGGFSTIFSRVKRLKVSEYRLFVYWPWVVESSAGLHHLSSVTSLSLHGIVWRDPTSLIDFVRGFRQLNKLEINQNWVDSIDIFFKAIDSFTPLNRVSFRKIEFEDRSHISEHHFGGDLSPIRNLEFREGSHDVLLNWSDFLGQRRMVNVTTLCVLDIKESHLESFGEIIRTLGPTVERLEIGLYMQATYAVQEGVYNDGQCILYI
jgi:hypothetical protein